MVVEKFLGFGCFNFGFKAKPPFKFSSILYKEELKRALSEIPNLSNLKIGSHEAFDRVDTEKLDIIINNALPRMREDSGYFPDYYSLNIRFDIYILSHSS